MQAMVLTKTCSIDQDPEPLAPATLPDPVPAQGEIVVKISVCGVCHTELDEIEGRTPPPRFPIVPGHQVVGKVAETGRRAERFRVGERVGIGWIYAACGRCRYCRSGQENLCADFVATGRDAHGGYAEYIRVSENFAHRIPETFTDSQAAPLLCAGAIGFRSVTLSGLSNGQSLGLTGFGASAHLVLKMVRHQFPETGIFVFARSEPERAFAMDLGAAWAGDTTAPAPIKLDAIIDTTPAWTPVVEALKNLSPGGRLVINAIRKEERDKASLAALDYPAHLWLEKEIKSVANVTRDDIRGFLELAAAAAIKPDIEEFSLNQANRALRELKTRKIRGAKVLRID